MKVKNNSLERQSISWFKVFLPWEEREVSQEEWQILLANDNFIIIKESNKKLLSSHKK